MDETVTEQRSDPALSTRVVLRPLGNPLPAGFVGLAGATIALTGLQLGWVPVGESHQIGWAMLLIAVPLQLIACVLGFLSRDPGAGTGMGTLAVAWLTVAVITLSSPPGARSAALGLMLFFLAGAVLLSAVVTSLGKGLAALVLGIATARFAVTGVYEYVGGTASMHAAGWLGLALCLVALYGALAFELESVRHATILPTLRHGLARRALSGAGLSTAGPAHRDAGAREQL